MTVGSSNLERAGMFYDALLIPLGLKRRVASPGGGPMALCWDRTMSINRILSNICSKDLSGSRDFYVQLLGLINAFDSDWYEILNRIKTTFSWFKS
jgi:hypothetical protein